MNNYNFDNYNMYRNMSNDNYFPYMNNNMNNINNVNLFNPTEGFEKGNLFSNLYSEYKNYMPIKFNPKNEQEKMLYDLQTICFATHELNLYLDLHPDNQSMLTLYNDYMRKERELTKQYEEKYGPLTTNSTEIGDNSFKWVENKWPWEVDE